MSNPPAKVANGVGAAQVAEGVTSTPPISSDLGQWAVPVVPLAAFLAAQVGCLAVCLLHVPLAATVRDGEAIAVQVLLAGQIGAAAVLSAGLARTFASAAIAAASLWPAALLAGAIQAEPIAHTTAATAGATAWIALLAACNAALPNEIARRMVATGATLWAVGGALLAYVAIEFAGDSNAPPTAPGPLAHTPILAVWRLAAGDAAGWGRLIAVFVVLALALVGIGVRGYARLRPALAQR